MQTTDPHKTLAAALGRIPSGVYILTAMKGKIETGMLASWVQQCSFSPPLITFVLSRGRPIAEILAPGDLFTLNILESAQTDMIAHFGKGFAITDDAFATLDVRREAPYGPILTEAHACLFGKVIEHRPAGDHELYLAEITAGNLLEEGQPMVHIRKNGFHY